MNDLTTTSSGIAAEHAELISGLEAVFAAFIDANYVQNTDIQVPPHGLPKDPIAVAPLRAAGLAPSTIELIGRLPCFTNDVLKEQQKLSSHIEGIPITPTSSATSYLLGPGRYDESRDVGPDTEDKLSPTSFKVATATSPNGFNLAYDLSAKTILEWHPSRWSSCERYPVKTYLDEWERKLRTLEWLPWRSQHGWQIELRVDDSTNVHEAVHNRYWAKCQIYFDAGWPESFDQESFTQRQDAFNAKEHALGAIDGAGKEQTERGKELLGFYKAAAGSHAV